MTIESDIKIGCNLLILFRGGWRHCNDPDAWRNLRSSRHRNDVPRRRIDELGGGSGHRCTGHQEMVKNRSTLL